MLYRFPLRWGIVASVSQVILINLKSALSESSINEAVGLLLAILFVAVATTIIAHFINRNLFKIYNIF